MLGDKTPCPFTRGCAGTLRVYGTSRVPGFVERSASCATCGGMTHDRVQGTLDADGELVPPAADISREMTE